MPKTDTPSIRRSIAIASGNKHHRRRLMLDAYILSEVEGVTDVCQWIEENAHGRRFELFVEMQAEPLGPFTSPRKSDLIRPAGSKPQR